MNTSQQVELGKLFFEEGIPGFTHLQFYQLIQEEESVFLLLQSLEDKEIGFWLVKPFNFFPEYQFSLPPAAETSLGIKEADSVAVFTIVTVRENNEVTINLKAPIVINLENRMAKQVVLTEDHFSVRQPLFEIKSAMSE